MTGLDPNTMFTVLMGAGGATAVGAMVKGYLDIRRGARARDRDTVGSLREQRDDADRRARLAREDSDYWQRQCGRLVFQVEAAGLDPDTGPEGLIPPSQRAPAIDPPPARPRRGRRPAGS